jgi:uncharacterized membrane-anchored protein
MTPYDQLKDMSYVIMLLLIGGLVASMSVWAFYAYVYNKGFQVGYWSGRSAGWKASIEHNQKIEKLKSRAVFDYDKH